MFYTYTHKKKKPTKKKTSWYKQQSFVLQDIIRTSHFTTITVSLHLISCYIKINLGDSCLVCHAAYWSYFFLFQGKQRVLKYCCMGCYIASVKSKLQKRAREKDCILLSRFVSQLSLVKIHHYASIVLISFFSNNQLYFFFFLMVGRFKHLSINAIFSTHKALIFTTSKIISLTLPFSTQVQFRAQKVQLNV